MRQRSIWFCDFSVLDKIRTRLVPTVGFGCIDVNKTNFENNGILNLKIQVQNRYAGMLRKGHDR